MNGFRTFWSVLALVASVFVVASCGPDAPGGGGGGGGDGGGDGGFKVFVSKSGGGGREVMDVNGETTFGDVRSFAATEFGLAADGFRLMVAGKYPEDGEKLSDHGFKAEPGAGSVPTGNIIVRVND